VYFFGDLSLHCSGISSQLTFVLSVFWAGMFGINLMPSDGIVKEKAFLSIPNPGVTHRKIHLLNPAMVRSLRAPNRAQFRFPIGCN